MQRKLALLILFIILLTACGSDSPSNSTNNQNASSNQTDPNQPGATQDPEYPLTICLAEAPNTLKPYGSPNAAAQLILQALTDGPIDPLNYTAYSPAILEALPSLADGTASIQSVNVQIGQPVLTDRGEVKPLDHGDLVRPAGCNSSDCAVFYDGNSFKMDQLTATFTLKPSLTWSDGAPLTAYDSVFGFNLNINPDTPTSKYKTDRTTAYTAIDDLTVRWTGIPGFLDQSYPTNFWPPAPQHLWDELTPAEISAAPPLGYGPYRLVQATSDEIILEPNLNYFRAAEELPLATSLTFRVVGQDPADNLRLVRTGECDILGPTASAGLNPKQLLELEEDGQVLTAWADAGSWELINIGIQPVSYDNGYRPNFFGEPIVRQALAMCIDRQRIVDQIAFGKTEFMNTYLAPTHPLNNSDVLTHPYDPTAAAQLLDQAGWVIGPDGVRAAVNITEISEGALFEINYYFLDDSQSEIIAQLVAQDLTACGIKVNLASGPAEQLLAEGPDGLLFGRQFDLAQFSWQTADQPSCFLYLSEAIPGGDLNLFPYTWGGWNLTGWANPEFDAACKAAQNSLPGQDSYAANHRLAQAIFAQEMPVIPLFTHQQFIIARPDLCGLDFDPTAGMLWNIEEIGWGGACP